MRKQFDIKYRPQIESGEYKIMTRDGHEARIICWDACEDQPIVAVVSGLVHQYTLHGYANYLKDNDLFIVTPEPELTEFERTLRNGTNIYVEQGRCMEDWDARQDAKDLMGIARKELQREIDAEIKEDTYLEYKKSRANALKDLPDGCW